MGKIYGGVNGAAAEIKKIYGGVGSVAKEISKVYAGVNGVAQLIWEKTSRQRVSLPDMTSRSAPSGYCAEVLPVRAQVSHIMHLTAATPVTGNHR